MLIFADHEPNLAKNPLLKWLKNHIRVTDEYHGDKFWVNIKGVRWFTPMFLVLVLIECSDVIFAMDSIPAIFAITSDPFIVFTSNIFAILGLRALYFLLADMAERFHLLKYGLAIVLVFVGVKMANILEVNTINGSLVMAKIAGMLSMAKITSENSINTNTKNIGVNQRTPLIFTQNLSS